MKKNLKNYSYTVILVIVLAVLVAVLAAASPYFFSWKNCRNILNQSAIYLVLSVGMTLVICAGQIDLSVGAVIGFSGMSMGMLIKAGLPASAAIPLGLAIAAFIGLVNGWIVAYGRINSFIVTLSTMTIIRGIILVLTNSKSVFGFGPEFGFIGSGKIGPVNMPILISIMIAVIGAILLHKTRFGNYCLFIGSNEIALRECKEVQGHGIYLLRPVCRDCGHDRDSEAEFGGAAGRTGV